MLKDIRRAIARGVLTEDGACVAESFHLLEEALRSSCEVRLVVASESVRSVVAAHIKGLNVRLVILPDALFRAVSSTETSQGVIALVRPPEWNLDQLFRGNSLVIVLDAIQDPGNAGSIVRAAEAFGASGVVFLKGSVSPHNPKTLRASAGSLFRVPFVIGVEDSLLLATLQQKKVDLYATMPRGEKTLEDVDFTRRCAIVIGSEGRGVSETLNAKALDLRIPTAKVESLNAAVAAGIVLYEARRQRVRNIPA